MRALASRRCTRWSSSREQHVAPLPRRERARSLLGERNFWAAGCGVRPLAPGAAAPAAAAAGAPPGANGHHVAPGPAAQRGRDEEECDDEAGGCHAPWGDDLDVVSRPHLTTVRAQLLETDPGLNASLMSSGTTVAQIFNQDLWEKHRSVQRYALYMQRWRFSTVLRRTFRPCLCFTLLSVVVGIVNTAIPRHWPQFGMPMVPHTLLGAALSLLLVFRTNSSFARFTEGRMLWGALIRYCRDFVRLAATYTQRDLFDRAARYVQVLAFTLKAHLRKGRTRADPNDPTAFRDDPTQVVQELLSPSEAAEVLAQPNRPFYVICKMTALSREMASRGAPRHVMLSLEKALSELLGVIGGCDRILGTPIPLSYTRHTARSLVVFLATLPLALWPVLGWLSVPSMSIISYIFAGIDEIAIEQEEPFCLLPLLPMCKTIVSDVQMAMAAMGGRA